MRPDDSDYPDSYYAATARYRPRISVLDSDIRTDVAIIGGGFGGISCALELASHGYSVAVLEANRIGWGASGRNGGQMLSGGFGEVDAMARRYGARAGEVAGELSRECVTLIRERIARYGIDCDLKSGAASVAVSRKQLRVLREKYTQQAQTARAGELQWFDREEMTDLVGTDRYLGGYIDRRDGHVHPLNLCLGQAVQAETSGARLYEHTRVSSVTPGSRCRVHTPAGDVDAEFVVVCCNAYLEGLVPAIAGQALPAGSFIVATAPLDEKQARLLLPQDCSVSDENVLLDYYRLSADRRLLFGGRYTYSGAAPDDVREALRKRMLRVFPALDDVSIEYDWGGKVAISISRIPQLGRVHPNVFYAQGYSGHGLAQSNMAGRLIADAIRGQAERFDVFAAIRHPRLPGGNRFAPFALASGFLYYRMRDILGW